MRDDDHEPPNTHARFDDPQTSFDAIPRNIVGQMLRVLAAYADGVPRIDHDAYTSVGMSSQNRQRCSDLRHAGMIERTGERGVTPFGKEAYLCVITPKGRAWLEPGQEWAWSPKGKVMHQKSELRPYQTRVVDYLYENPEAFCVLKMGAGKTASTLTAISDLIDDGEIRHALIVAPKRVANMVWPDEIQGWEHLCDLQYAVLNGTPSQRLALLDKTEQRHVTIIGIDNIQWLITAIEKWPDDHFIFDCLVIDETSKLKSPTSKRAKALAKVAHRFRNRWGLTGTPRPNSMTDLFNPVKILTDSRLWGRSFYKWQAENFYKDPHDFHGYKWLIHQHREAVLLADAATISIALEEGEMPGLPELSIIYDKVVLPADAREAYDDMEAKLLAELSEADILAASAAVATGKLAQIANGFVYDEAGAAGVHDLHEEKSQWLADLIEELDGEPLLVVYQYQEDLAMIRRLCGDDLPYLGSGVSDVKAARYVELWNRGELPVLAMHPASAGHGLNLQHGGSRMAWIAPTWSPEMWDQTLARLHRPGQEAHVMVHVCMAEDTVDQLKQSRVLGKLSAQAAFEQYLAERSRAGRLSAKGT
jgi:SNF2 family DNA or RNA helicase